MKHRPTSRSHCGLTLLELMVSLVILGVLTTLTATLWSQVRSWSAAESTEQPATRMRRVMRLAEEQWNDRRSVVPLGEGQATVRASATRLEFLTATPILFKEWPLVRARYLVEPIETSSLGALEPEHRLVYEETRVTQFDYVSDEGSDSAGNDRSDSVVLLDTCSGIRFEQWIDPRARSINTASAAVGADVSEWQALPEDPIDAALRPERRDEHDEESLEPIEKSAQKEEDPHVETSPLRAVRCIGHLGKEPFEWVLVVEPLR